jgi:hypothetical protein
VLLADPDGWVSSSAWRAIHDAAFTGVPIWHLRLDEFLPFHEIGFDAFQPINWRQYAHVTTRSQAMQSIGGQG